MTNWRISRRCRVPELMDDPGLDRPRHFHALRGLERINRYSATVQSLAGAIRKAAHQLKGRPLRVLDVATGAGDVPVRLWERSRKWEADVQIDGCDISAQGLEYAKANAARTGAEVNFFQLCALEDPLPEGYDVLTCSLFLHHLSDTDAGRVLKKMYGAAGRLVVVSDLLRSWAGLLAAYAVPRLLTFSEVVHVDAPRSVRAAFTPSEVRHLVRQAGIENFELKRRWPWRFLLTMEKRQ